MTSADPVEPRPEIDPDEVARLREEVARLKAEQEPTAPGGRRGWWRPVVAGLLVAIAALLAPLSVLSTWASGQIQDTDRYLATVAPLASDPDVQAAVVARVEEVIYSYLDLDAAVDEVVEALEGQGLPPRAAATLGALAGPLDDRHPQLRPRPHRGAGRRRTPSRRPGSRPTGRRTSSWWPRCWATPGEPSRSTTARSA